ncbi:hypothetical protein FFI89_014220 [Bradyrhizobium sp. KBS0727]|uniref:hypothetical protein n=1 Tax=unclassified Bradyrhizobium TaxID=2631580 RepID=UPI00110EB73A|nr:MULTISPECIES: hypothetical protein [unclassified Bradyrhizobium]QDW38199.1 hypothetical protein FFI71_014215 [Bradyrhizobium sp. KBS0725]QDW44802.1 hypothetical protein FFI89_014220 [Bradyrhizobium sp. KBS0727]
MTAFDAKTPDQSLTSDPMTPDALLQGGRGCLPPRGWPVAVPKRERASASILRDKDDHEHARHAGDYRDAAAYCWRSMLHFGIDKSLNGKTASGLLLRQPTKLKYLDQDNHRPDPQRRA